MVLSAPTAKTGRLRRFLPLLALFGLAGVAFVMGWHKYLTLESLVRNRAMLDGFVAAHPAAALALYTLIYVAVTAMGLPGALILTVTGGLLFGAWLAGAATVVGATAGATAIFLIARTAAGAHLADRAGALAARLAGEFRRNAFNYLLFLRLVPAFPFFLVNLVPALCNVRLRTYVAATALGIIPGTFAFASVGAGLDSVIAAQAAQYRACLSSGAASCHIDFKLNSLVTPQVLIALAALGVLALVPVVARRVLGRRQDPPAADEGDQSHD